ncbi:MAG: hypothetical protein WC723_03450 [Candidatus Omnitrophota bacterium]
MNRKILILILIFAAALAIRVYQLSIFEYKNDQYFAILLGNDTRNSHFLVTHGMLSGVGVNNPPAFLYIMGLLTGFTNDPFYLTFFFFGINILALALAMFYFYRTLPGIYAILSSAFLALFPAFTFYSSNIWAQCLLPLIMIILNINLYKFIKYGNSWNFFAAFILTALAAQLHMSGFFIFPALLIILIYRWNKVDKRTIGAAIFLSFLLFVPYLIHLFLENGLHKIISYGASFKRDIPWKVFPAHIRMSSFDFFRYYFKHDFNSVLRGAAGLWSFVLYPLTFIPAALFVFGFLSYLKWLIKGRRFFSLDDDINKRYPLPFQICGLLITVVTLGYLVLRVRTPMHYFILLFPAYSLITGFAAFKAWKTYWGKLTVLLGIISTVFLLAGVLIFLDKAGGHPHEYGISYKELISWRKDIQSAVSKGACFNVKANFTGKGKADKEVTEAVLSDKNGCRAGTKPIPVEINIGWNSKTMRYEHSIHWREPLERF